MLGKEESLFSILLILPEIIFELKSKMLKIFINTNLYWELKKKI